MNAVVAHGGGPTSVINASLAGLIESCRQHKQFRALYGARFGVRGLLSQQWTELLAQDADLIERVGRSPGSVLGSSRQKLSEDDYQRILEIFDRNNIHCFFYTGGNGSMDTALRVARFARGAGYTLQVIGIPKTIDNDLCITDHTPGYASTAHFFAIAARDIGEDNRALPSPVCVLEVLGRNAGWVVAATALARKRDDDAPHLIYFPEKPVSLDRIAGDVERVYSRLGRVVIAVCEGQVDETGNAFGADVDRAGSNVHRLASNLGHTLARLIAQKLNVRARAEKPGLFGRCCGPLSTKLDREEARMCGSAAAEAAAEGRSDAMIALHRESDAPYRSSTFLVPLEEVARAERLLPLDWIAPEANDVTPAFLNYVSPLIPDIERYEYL
ncbi:MAG: diphosphate--fructose-6-phosphate 1-phosphotransferase [Acidobacteriaceae bacterium]|nr:diphosphate--fructose-6-phosphate 1-phosphotransferase [Acidobacteriaceae bacterium]MBV9764129.1 diphosphate--fructose-6-phosphate 1-phosphotransferase [Acidobacteriaceae bacterium]